MLTLQVILTGILVGGLYACMALGFSVIWGVTNLINLAHGSMIIMGAYVTWLITTHAGIDPFLTVPISGAILFAFGYLLQRQLLNRVVQASLFMTLIFTFGLNMLLVNVNLALFSGNIRSITMPYAGSTLEFGDIRLPYARIAVFGIAVLSTLLLYLFMNHTRTGQTIRATAQNVRSAGILGIDTRQVYALTFGIGAAMAGMAGSLVAILYSFSPVTGEDFTLKSFVIVVLGGLGSIPGTIIAGILLGIAENLVSGLLAPGYADAISYFLLVLFLILWPRGLFGKGTQSMPQSESRRLPSSRAPGFLIHARAGGAVSLLLVLVGALLLLAGPSVLSLYWLRVFSDIFMYAVVAQGINIISGYTGYPAFGNVVFFGVGAYSTAILMVKLQLPFAAGLLTGACLCPLLALLLGPPLLRLKGHYFAIATLGLNEAIKEVVSNGMSISGGGMGLSLPLASGGPVADARMFYYLFLIALMLSTWTTWEFSRRRLGLACRAIRDNEIKAEAMGLHTTRAKTTAWMISAAITGVAGGIYAYWMTYIEPSAGFDIAIAVKSFVIFLLGGAGTLFGPVIGSFLVEFLEMLTWSHLLSWHLGIMGIIIMLVIALFPDGLGAAIHRRPRRCVD